MITSEAVDDNSSETIRPVVEVVLDQAATTDGGKVPHGSATSAAAMLAALAKRSAPPPAEPPAPVEPQPDPPADPPAEAAAEQPAPAAEPSADPPAEERPAAEPADKLPADPAPPPAPPAPAADPIELATLKAELEAARRDAAIARALPSTDDTDARRQRWTENPLSELRGQVAAMLGRPADSKEVSDELAYLQIELAREAIGVDNLPDESRRQRSQEQMDRRWRVQQLAQAASTETAAGRERYAAGLRAVSSAIEATAAEYPYLALAKHLDGIDPAKAADALWTQALEMGAVKPGATHAESVREAIRLTNGYYQQRYERITGAVPKNTAPVPAIAPTQASAPTAAPGTVKQQTPLAPAKTGSAPPGALTARQAAAAPSAKAQPAKIDRTPIVVDPTDRDGHRARIAEIAAKHQRH